MFCGMQFEFIVKHFKFTSNTLKFKSVIINLSSYNIYGRITPDKYPDGCPPPFLAYNTILHTLQLCCHAINISLTCCYDLNSELSQLLKDDLPLLLCIVHYNDY